MFGFFLPGAKGNKLQMALAVLWHAVHVRRKIIGISLNDHMPAERRIQWDPCMIVSAV